MCANELGMCHHNAERPVVHLGVRVPMQTTGMMGEEEEGGAGWMVNPAYCARFLAH